MLNTISIAPGERIQMNISCNSLFHLSHKKAFCHGKREILYLKKRDTVEVQSLWNRNSYICHLCKFESKLSNIVVFFLENTMQRSRGFLFMKSKD